MILVYVTKERRLKSSAGSFGVFLQLLYQLIYCEFITLLEISSVNSYV